MVNIKEKNNKKESRTEPTLEELEKITKLLKKKDIELSEIQKKRENEIRKLRKNTEELSNSRKALMNILEDVEETRLEAVKERDKTVSIINHFVDGIMVVDRYNNLELINPAAERIFDLKNKEIKGKNIRELKENPYFSGILDLLLEKDNIKILERVEFSPKKELIMEITTISLTEGDKNFGYLINFHDITREKMIERLKTEFVSVAAHQLRTPLSAIRWSISLLREEKTSKKDREDLLEKCAQSNDRMINLVNDLLNVSRIEEGRYIYDFEPKNILKIVEQSISAAKEEAKNKNINFQYIYPKEKMPSLNMDEEKISLAIQNLVENAIHYTNKGGRVLFKINYDKTKQELLFSIEDSGVGIPKEQQQRIFTKFFRAENVMRMQTEGSGLGLFIAKNIIESHGGKIWFSSEEGKGTSFYFVLPVRTQKEIQQFLKNF